MTAGALSGGAGGFVYSFVVGWDVVWTGSDDEWGIAAYGKKLNGEYVVQKYRPALSKPDAEQVVTQPSGSLLFPTDSATGTVVALSLYNAWPYVNGLKALGVSSLKETDQLIGTSKGQVYWLRGSQIMSAHDHGSEAVTQTVDPPADGWDDPCHQHQ